MNTINRKILFLMTALVFIFMTPAFADFQMIRTEIAEDNSKYVGKVFLNDALICKFYSASQVNLKQKIDNIAARLDKAINDSIPADKIKCVAGKREALVKTDKDVLFTVSPNELGPGEFSAFSAAQDFLEKLKIALNLLPDIKFSERIVVVPRGKTVKVKIFGAENNNYTLEGYSADVIEVADKTSESIDIRGITTGSTRINFIYPPLRKQIIVVVKESAGTLPAGLRVQVTGNPATADIIKEAVLLNLHQKIEVRHGARTTISMGGLNAVGSLYPYKTRAVAVPVALTGKDLIKVAKNVYVQIENKPVALNDATYLMVSDRPETIVNNGKLFEGEIKDNGVHRLLFHHKCYEYSYPRSLDIRLVNDSGQNSVIYVIRGFELGYGEFDTGYYGGKNYFLAYLSRKGYVLELNPNSYASVVLKRLAPGQLISGLVNFQVLKGALPKVIVQSSTYRHSNYSMQELSEGKEVHPRGTFPTADIKLDFEHYLGEAYTFIDIGNKPFLKEINTGEPCYGNYGAFYNVNISLINNAPDEKRCEILFQARAGPARAVFLIDGQLFLVENIIRFPNETVLKKYVLGPNQTKKVNIITFPLAGINYPAVILVRSYRDN